MRADGSIISVEIYARSFEYQGRPSRIFTAIDVTESRAAAQSLRQTRHFLDTVIESVPAPILVKRASDLCYVLLNRAAETFLGVGREAAIGKTAYDFMPRPTAEMIDHQDRSAIRSGRLFTSDPQPVETPGNGVRTANSRLVPLHRADGVAEYVIEILEDVTERQEAEQRISFLAHHDALTRLPNRAAYEQRIAKTIDTARRASTTFGLVCLDLDRFKETNDVFGHQVGDALLVEVAARLQRAAGGDTFLARLGGDEFVLILEGASAPDILALTERLQDAVAADIVIGGRNLRSGLSIGVATFPQDGQDADTLLADADAALYRAKADGRGTVRFFEAAMDRQIRERRALQVDLRSAVERGQIVLHYQPQATVDGKVIGMEALVRWRHPGRGWVPPSTFIPLAEETGTILELGEWILREACREAASWRNPLSVSVNLSPVQFRHGDLPGIVHSALLRSGLAPSRLELEITEGVLLHDFERATTILRRIKSIGVAISMDNFGTGYSSLSYLQSFPFDKIKIDQSFISNLLDRRESAMIVRAVIALGRGLNLPVLAEGVESDAQMAFLRTEACDQVQGYLVGRPAPIERYSDLTGNESTSASEVA